VGLGGKCSGRRVKGVVQVHKENLTKFGKLFFVVVVVLFTCYLQFQMRHLFVIIDMSAPMADQDLKPSRILTSLKV
jgi:hypothetical protein